MKKNKKIKHVGLSEKQIEVGYLYFTTANQYRAVLAMKGEFLIYAPSSEGIAALSSTEMPFENSTFKKCQIVTFAKKQYQDFEFNGSQAIKHKLNESQLAEAVAQCNAKSAIAALLAE
ncbi:MAG: hypothetical protein M0R33_21485 [Methylomonas sp.]|jgi:hypothetical protein|uniref:hypothetical protein n=1 Tax=Methylomonas sp. TaxID=418 RepID=UPI0025CCF3D4|nr:hypothetical protein [Methylomonas sp.]MCK9609018.1 hypothetical protein [Methylomonas sp.]